MKYPLMLQKNIHFGNISNFLLYLHIRDMLGNVSVAIPLDVFPNRTYAYEL